MITVDEYFHDSEANFGFVPQDSDYLCAQKLLDRVNLLFPECQLRSGHRTREKTLQLIAAGYRAALGGQHEQSNAVDISDPDNSMDDGLTDDELTDAGLYREAPESTPSWVHLQSVAPKSGHRTFLP